MLRNAFHALAYWTPALLICLAVVARAAAPFPYHEADYTQPVIESLVAVTKQRSDKDNLYIKVDGGDPSAAILTELNSRKLPPTFAPWSARSPKEDHCRALGAVIEGGCLRDNFLDADFLSMPLWHVALVHIKAGACTAELTLVLGTSQWHIVSQRAACS